MNMNLSLIALAIFAIGLMTVAVIEWVKGWPLWKKKTFPEWFPSVASPILNLAFGQLVAPLVLIGVARGWAWGLALGLLGLAVSEFGYQILIQSVPAILTGVVSKIVPPKDPPTP
jgi:hypothetical protein